MSDESLIKACAKGDELAQKRLFNQLSPQMYGVCLRYAVDEHQAMDMLQDGFVKVFQGLDSYGFGGSFEGWVRRIVVNTCLDTLRREKKHRNQQEIDDDLLSEGADEEITTNINAEELLKLVQKLPEGYRMVFNMYVIEGYPHKEIAETLGITESTSKTQLRKAKLQLQEWVNGLNLRY
jgi:RNA polymerase sigma-70 factor (ECF subfamily)